MTINRKTAVILGSVVLLLGAVLSALWTKRPLGDSRPVDFASGEFSQAEREAFLASDFPVVKSVKSLPSPVVELFTEQGGSRLTMADPGKKFEATDVTSDPSLPSKRLIFGGSLGQKCFVHYEQGGVAHEFVLVLFEMSLPGTAKAVWRGSCGPAKDLPNLRELVLSGKCSDDVPREMR